MVKLIPIMLGYLPVGISFTVIAAEAGLSNAEIIGMSIFVLGAASQIAAVSLIDLDYGVFYIAFVTFLINFRHAALSVSLSPALRKFSYRELAVFSYGLTDEAFSIHTLDLGRNTFTKRVAIAVNVGTHLIWILSTIVGCYIGFFILEHLSFIHLDFALPAMFLSIVTIYMKTKISEFGLPKTWLRYVLIISATVIMTLLLLLAELKSFAFFLPALVVAACVFITEHIKHRASPR